MNEQYLCTFSGRFGDILWSLPTVRALSKQVGKKVDLGIMPAYAGLLPLLNRQNYIQEAFVMNDWILEGSPFGDQPWKAPEPEKYKKVWHLTYRYHPNGMSLMEFIATQHAISFGRTPIPFINVTRTIGRHPMRYISYAFNDYDSGAKESFLGKLEDGLGDVSFVDVSKMPWDHAADAIYYSTAFVGCRSANWVLAAGVGKKNIITFETHPNRRASGSLGLVFGNPYVKEYYYEYLVQSDVALTLLRGWLLEESTRRENELTTTNAG